jgi:hypothetical protein
MRPGVCLPTTDAGWSDLWPTPRTWSAIDRRADRPQSRRKPRSLSVPRHRRKRWSGGLCASAGIWSGCARTRGLILVRDPGRVGDEMVNGVIPRVRARPLDLSGAAGDRPGRQELRGSRPHVIDVIGGGARVEAGSGSGREGGVAELAESTGLNVARGIAFDRRGDLYVADAGDNTIRRFSRTGEDLGVFASTGLSHPRSLPLTREAICTSPTSGATRFGSSRRPVQTWATSPAPG